ncbi:MAG: tRNA pseudouridine(38-40) synthase TruA [Deltaproteobacteria bacterium]|nr:tRNA pseudouridine(38-40) synthase TruA [Deltaproteobacteria bacterium]
MKTVKLVVEYNGARYVGWQVQAKGMSVQGELEKALAEIVGHPLRVIGAGRTDAGVHALGMTAHFRTAGNLPMSAFREGVNRLLPEDIAVKRAEEACPGFHARYNARGKWYRYTIIQSPAPTPLRAPFSWRLRKPLDLEAVREAAAAFVGVHDFAPFRSSGCAAKTSVREIFSLSLQSEGELLFIDVRGSGFLKNMVRMMVGTLTEIGRGKEDPGLVARMLATGKPQAPITAPPQGLCLMEVFY